MSLDNPLHLAFLLLLVLLVFGARRLPELGRSLGLGLRGFRDTLTGEDNGHTPAGELPAPRSGE
jgi:sec-independent protein translocase protein TatA